MATLTIIQGDDKHIKVNFSGNGADEIKGFYFSSTSLGISKYFGEKVDDVWVIDLTSEETKTFEKGTHSFDITVETNNGNTITAIYNGTICVHEKVNKTE